MKKSVFLTLCLLILLALILFLVFKVYTKPSTPSVTTIWTLVDSNLSPAGKALNLSGSYPTVNGASFDISPEEVMNYVSDVNSILDSGSFEKCRQLVGLGKPELVDGCYFKIAHDHRNSSMCSVIADSGMREYCITRIAELRQSERLDVTTMVTIPIVSSVVTTLSSVPTVVATTLAPEVVEPLSFAESTQLAVLNKDPSFCVALSGSLYKDQCLSALSVSVGDTGGCDSIKDEVAAASCIIGAAIVNNNVSQCDLLLSKSSYSSTLVLNPLLNFTGFARLKDGVVTSSVLRDLCLTQIAVQSRDISSCSSLSGDSVYFCNASISRNVVECAQIKDSFRQRKCSYFIRHNLPSHWIYLDNGLARFW